MAKTQAQQLARFNELRRKYPSFNVLLDDGKTWLCPYCGKHAVADRKAKNFTDLALKHLLDKCPKARGLQGRPMEIDQLQQIVQLHLLTTRFAPVPGWRISIGNGKWLCPYCIQRTDVEMTDKASGTRPTDDIVRDIRSHLSRCYSYTQDPSKWHTIEEIRAAIHERKQQEAFAQQVAERMETDNVFQFSDRFGHWVCPFCEKPIASVDYSSPLARQHTAPTQAAAHFLSGTCKYQSGPLDPKQTVKAMQELTKEFLLDTAPAEDTQVADPGDTQYLSAIKTELSELRSHLERNKEFQDNLERARRAQQHMLPTTPTTVAGFEIEVYFNASEEVSGDFYDFIALPNDRLGVVIGDVSGHGIDAGIVMGMTKKAFNLRAQADQDPAATVTQVNEDIFPELGKTTFVTAVYGILDPSEGSFVFVRCGHTFPILCQPDADKVEEVLSDGLVLGSLHGDQFAKKSQMMKVHLGPGLSITLLTDGILEAMTEAGEEFGKDRILETISRHKHSPARGIIEGLLGSVQMFTQGHPQGDDQTMIVIRKTS